MGLNIIIWSLMFHGTLKFVIGIERTLELRSIILDALFPLLDISTIVGQKISQFNVCH